MRSSLFCLAALPFIGLLMVSGCTAANWEAAANQNIEPRQVEGVLIDHSGPESQREVVVSYGIRESSGTIWYLAFPVDASLKPQAPYTGRADFNGRPTVGDQQYGKVAATPFSVERSRHIAARMKSRDFLPLGAPDGIDKIRSFGAMESNGLYWMQYWPTSQTPATPERQIKYGYVLLLPPSYPRPAGDQAANIAGAAAATRVTAVFDAIAVPAFVGALASPWGPQIWNSMGK